MIATKQGLEALPGSSRIWIYQADRKLTDEEAMSVETEATQFVEGWNAHGQKLASGFEFVHNQFLILAVDESAHAASGCSIDTSVDLIRRLNEKLGVDFLNRQKVAVWSNDQVVLFDLPKIKEAIQAGHISRDTPVFHNLHLQLDQWRSNWMIPAEQSWLNRYFN